MKILKRILIALIALVVIVLVAALIAPKEFAVERDVTINQPKAQVFDYVKSLKNQNNYGAWNKMDPTMEQTYEGTDGTVGFTASWESENWKVGKGSQKITNVVDGERIDTELIFGGDENHPMRASMIVEEGEDENQTLVTWKASGSAPYPMNLMHVFMNMEKPFDQGLNDLKAILEEQETVTANGKDFLLDYYSQTDENLKNSVSGLSQAQLVFKPADSVWSVAQVLEHIVNAEPMIFGMTKQAMEAPQNPEMRDSLASTDAEIITGVTDRSQKFKAPDALQPESKYTDAKTALSDLKAGREPILKYIDSVSLESLRNHVSDLPTGKADAYQNLLFNAAHTARHTLQIEEVKVHENFPEE